MNDTISAFDGDKIRSAKGWAIPGLFKCKSCGHGNLTEEGKVDEDRVLIRVVCVECKRYGTQWTYLCKFREPTLGTIPPYDSLQKQTTTRT
jgi:hypothetical protein